jgi:signal transduction histidine kinase/streptogramin lyase
MPGCIYTSKEGVIWIGTDLGSLYRINLFQNKIPHYETSIKHIISFYEEPNGTLWMLNDEELIRTNKKNGTFNRNVIDENPSIKIEQTLKIIKEDRQGNVWFGSKDGLFRWDKKNESFINYKISPNNNFLSGNNVWTIYEDKKANFWIGKARGLSLLNRETGSVTEFVVYPNDTAEFGKNGITSIHEDKTGKLWIGTWYGGGIYQFNTETKEFKNILKDKYVSCIYEDSDGVLWVGCQDNLYKYDRSTNNFVPYIDPNSLSGITDIVSIVEDNQKYLWFGTWDGNIVSLNPQRNATVIYDKNDGVENDIVWNSAYKGRNGDLYFGDPTGYFSFDPEEFTRNSVPPNIVITDFLLADKPLKPGNGSPLKESLLQAKEIRLNFNQNIFSFEFVALDYSNPEETKYSCMLENFDTDWRKGNSERRAYFFNVPPGKYVFRVKAMNSFGIWAEKKIDVIILPPWWRTWWAYCIYGLLFIAIVFGIDRFQRVRLLKAEKERNRERELAQAKEIEKAYLELGKAHETLKSTQAQLIQSEKMASLGELTAGIAHEIQNPLNFVNNFSEVSKELIVEMNEELEDSSRQFAAGSRQLGEEKLNLAKEIAGDIEQNLEKINHHGKRAADIVKGMLLHSRTSSGVKEPTDINALADEYLRLAYHGMRAKDKSFNADFKLEADENLPKINVIPQDIGRVLLNLINNAFYAVSERAKLLTPPPPEGGSKNFQTEYVPTVTISTASFIPPSGGPRGVRVIVKDNGPGIPAHIVDKIFQPFFTTKPTGSGTGLGLSLSYDIVKAHGGDLKVETKEGEGSQFIIQLPISN